MPEEMRAVDRFQFLRLRQLSVSEPQVQNFKPPEEGRAEVTNQNAARPVEATENRWLFG